MPSWASRGVSAVSWDRCVDCSLLLLMGQILGGVFESPADNFPNIFLSEIGESVAAHVSDSFLPLPWC